MIQFEEVLKSYAGEIVLDHLTFKLNKGERCGLVGRNGTGKTTLMRLITGEETLDGGSITLPKGYTLGYLTQHLKFTKETLLEEVAAALRPEEQDQLHKAKKILFGLGFKEENLYAHPSAFSGGYQLRVHLAKVIVKEPDCLLLDEPTNYLDIVSTRWFTRFLKSWQGELILISHDRDFMDNVTTHTLGIHRKNLKKYEGGTEKFYAKLLEDEQIHELTRANLDKKRAHLESFITRFGAKASKATQAQSRRKALEKMPVLEQLVQLQNLNFDFPYSNFPGQKLLEASNVSFSYGKDPLIQNLSLTVEKQDRIAIIGKNGRGKSTILRLLARDLKPNAGTINIAENVRLGFFGQTNIDRLSPKMTIEEEIASASPHLNVTQVRTICGVMMFSSDKAKKPISVLSGGERSRVLLGKILASPCNLLLLDEPTNHLDMESIEALMDALDEFKGAVILVTHSEMMLRRIPDRFVICHQGNQHLFNGDYNEFLEKEGWESGEEKGSATKAKSVDHKEIKRKKAELINLRSKALQPFQKKIALIEKEISDLEMESEKDSEELVKASQKGDAALISQLSRKVDEKKKRMEGLFVEHEHLSQVIEEKRKDFENQISNLSQ